jgi:hypothetical protein
MARKREGADEQPTTIVAAGASDVKVSEHPRARSQIKRVKGWGGMVGFFIVAYFSWHSGADFVHAGMRALGGGLAGYVVAWTAAVYVWRQLAVAEVRQRARLLAEYQLAADDAAPAES